MREIPTELSSYFKANSFEEYPKVEIPQSFRDERGVIINIADGELGDVAIIESKAQSVRANHVHQSDWHLSYCLSGSLDYSFIEIDNQFAKTRIESGELFFTPAGVPHRMDFLEDTVLVVISRNSRKRENYDEDTRKYIVNSE